MTEQTETTELTSQAIRAGIAKAQSELDTLAPVIADLQAEQRKLAALATIGMLTDAKAARQREVADEIAMMQNRRTELAAGIEGAGEFLLRALETERVAQAKADWAEAEALLMQAQSVAAAAQKALEVAGANFAKLEGLLEEAASLAKPHVIPTSRSQLDAGQLHLSGLFGLVLKEANGPDFDCDVPYVPRPGRAPTIESVVARHVRRLLEWRDRQ
ncbi:hypothetical protein ACIU1J_05470 [Azospirillum doebereinerae]|uniref:hypothetical protein n=1 Tax=Azospirillum doebereinerae TaxID=92933 RepID=UPI001EE602F5|nr:hypothetical protein [Azospirillum doebereinerae]MCG5240865.1 hypothetical protein [Azospirillum doebereinerae]